MKLFKTVLFAFTIIFTASLLTGCGNSKKEIKIEKATDTDGKEYTSAYVCPMHCKGSGSDKVGKCPACGMDYVANENKEGDGHDHSEGDGHNHDNDDNGDDHSEGDGHSHDDGGHSH